MEILKTVLLILFAIDCIALTVIVLMQEGKSAGLGTIAGMADSYENSHDDDMPSPLFPSAGY
jgi:preprotein translocase subunit SecG